MDCTGENQRDYESIAAKVSEWHATHPEENAARIAKIRATKRAKAEAEGTAAGDGTRYCAHCDDVIPLSRWYRHRKNPAAKPRGAYMKNGQPCRFEGCDKPSHSKGWCRDHYKRYSYSGDPAGKYAPRGSGTVSRGYHLISEKGKQAPAHRKVMEAALGRPLRDDEVVHHIDGNRLNNDPDNLAVMSQSEHMRIHRPLRETCGKGHPFSEDNTRWKTYANGKRRRECITCIRAAANARYQRKKQH